MAFLLFTWYPWHCDSPKLCVHVCTWLHAVEWDERGFGRPDCQPWPYPLQAGSPWAASLSLWAPVNMVNHSFEGAAYPAWRPPFLQKSFHATFRKVGAENSCSLCPYSSMSPRGPGRPHQLTECERRAGPEDQPCLGVHFCICLCKGYMCSLPAFLQKVALQGS